MVVVYIYEQNVCDVCVCVICVCGAVMCNKCVWMMRGGDLFNIIKREREREREIDE